MLFISYRTVEKHRSNIINKLKIKSSKKVIAIGDSFNHDILGAMKQGFDSLFIENGIHRDDIKDLDRKKWYLSQFKPKYCQKPGKTAILAASRRDIEISENLN